MMNNRFGGISSAISVVHLCDSPVRGYVPVAGHRVPTDTKNERTVCHGRAFPARQPTGQRQLRDRAEHRADRAAVRRVPVPVGPPVHGALRRRRRAPRHVGVQVRRSARPSWSAVPSRHPRRSSPRAPTGTCSSSVAPSRTSKRCSPSASRCSAAGVPAPADHTLERQNGPGGILHRGPVCVLAVESRLRWPGGPSGLADDLALDDQRRRPRAVGRVVAGRPYGAGPTSAVRTLSTRTGRRRRSGSRASTTRVRRAAHEAAGDRQQAEQADQVAEEAGQHHEQPADGDQPGVARARARPAGASGRARAGRPAPACPAGPAAASPAALVASVGQDRPAHADPARRRG